MSDIILVSGKEYEVEMNFNFGRGTVVVWDMDEKLVADAAISDNLERINVMYGDLKMDDAKYNYTIFETAKERRGLEQACYELAEDMIAKVLQHKA